MFNSTALVVVIIIAIIVGPLYFFDFMTGWVENLIISSVTFVIGSIAAIAGYKARFFWILPVWLIGLGALLCLMFDAWGWWGILGLFGGTIGLFVLLAIIGTVTEKREWRRVPEALEEAKLAILEEDPEVLWSKLDQAFFIPGALSATVEMCDHNRKVIRVIKKHLAGLLSSDAVTLIDEVDRMLDQASRPNKDPEKELELDTDIMSELLVMLGVQGDYIRENPPEIEQIS